MQVHLRRLASAFVISTVLLVNAAFPQISGADSRQRLQQIQQQIKTTRERIDAGERQKQGLEGEIENADARMAAVQRGLTVLEGQLDDTRDKKAVIDRKLAGLRAQLARKQAELDAAIRELNRLTRLLNKRADHFYKHGQTSFIDVLVDARSFGDFLTRVAFVQRIVGLDAKLVKQITATKTAIEETKAAIQADHDTVAVQERALAAEVSRINNLVTAQAAQKAQLEAAVVEKQRVIAKLAADRMSLESLEATFEAEAQSILRRIGGTGAAGTAGSAPSSRGFIWPVSGSITGRFGEQRPGHIHQGIDIAVPTGTAVAASKGGTVAAAGYEGAFGYLVVIDHGDGFTTWYAHNSQVLVSAGQTVGRGQTISKAGSTGRSSGPHVHFEVRYRGAAQNPLNYLP